MGETLNKLCVSAPLRFKPYRTLANFVFLCVFAVSVLISNF
jgi:hypothetical protein